MDPLTVIGAVSAVASLAGAGAKLSLFLFEVSSQIGSAADEMRELASEISLFCAVLKQLQRVLGDAKRRRSSVTAIDTTQQIIERCKLIFRNIEDTIKSLRIDTSKSSSSGSGGDVGGLDLKRKIKWTLKRNKVQTHRATLESCKITLMLMVSTLAYADVLSIRRHYDNSTEIEDAEEEAILQSLSSAQLRANERLVSVEIEDGQDLEGEDHPLPPVYEPVDSRNPSSVIMWSGSVDASPYAEGKTGSLEKASTWMKRLSIASVPQQDTFRRISTASTDSITGHRQVERLLFKWTDQGTHWASLQQQGEEAKNTGLYDARNIKIDLPQEIAGFSFLVHTDSLPISPGTKPATEPKNGIL